MIKKYKKYKHGGSTKKGKKIYSYHNDGPFFDSPNELMKSEYWEDETQKGLEIFEYIEMPSGKIKLVGEVPLMMREEHKDTQPTVSLIKIKKSKRK